MGRMLFMLLVLLMLTFVCYAVSKLLKRDKRRTFDEDIEAVAKRIKMKK